MILATYSGVCAVRESAIPSCHVDSVRAANSVNEIRDWFGVDIDAYCRRLYRLWCSVSQVLWDQWGMLPK